MTHVVSGSAPLALTEIMQADINLAVWEREANSTLGEEVDILVKLNQWRDLRIACEAKTIPAALDEHFQGNSPALQADVLLLTEMFQCLFDAENIAVRLVKLNRAMCPRFHIDKIPCRLVSTYHGAGTEWLEETSIERAYLGRGAKGMPDHSSGLIKAGAPVRQLTPFSVALLKGDAWPDNEGRGLVHRSPAVKEGDQRILITLDFA